MSKYALIFCVLILPSYSRAQEPGEAGIIASVAEELAADENNSQDVEYFYDMLRELNDDPVLINSADEKEISRLFFLSGFQVKILCDYIKTYGRILTPFEIQNIPGFDQATARMMISFISLKYDLNSSPDSVKFQHSLVSNFILKPSVQEQSYLGSPWKILTRYSIRAGQLAGGFTLEKDQGEKLISGKPPIPDFFSTFISYKGAGIIKKIIIGDYSVKFGQGLALNTTAVTGFSLTTPYNLSGKDEIKPYTSADENNFFRGLAVVSGIKNSELSIFLSSEKIDANLNDSLITDGVTIKSLYKGGYHNTSLLLSKKDIIKEISAGIGVSQRLNNLSVGMLITGNRFSVPFVTNDDGPGSLYEFRGSTNILFSGYYSLLVKRFILSGEFTTGGNGKYAFVQNFAIHPSERLTINLTLRDYTPQFISFHGRGPGGTITSGNEKGITGSFIFEAAKYLFISAGADFRIYPWLRYRCSSPSSSERHEIRIRYLPSEKMNFEFLYGFRLTEYDDTNEYGIAKLSATRTHSIRMEARFLTTDYLTLTSRLDYKNASPSIGAGYCLIQDMVLRLRKIPVSIWFRYSVFSTSSYYSGIYTWENDLLYSFNVPVLYGDGSRSYLMLKWKAGRNTEIRFKYGFTSSSIDKTPIKYSDDYKFQIIFKL